MAEVALAMVSATKTVDSFMVAGHVALWEFVWVGRCFGGQSVSMYKKGQEEGWLGPSQTGQESEREREGG